MTKLHSFPEALGENPFLSPSPTSRSCLPSLARGFFLHYQSRQWRTRSSSHRITPTLTLCLCLPHVRALVIALGPPRSSRIILSRGQLVSNLDSACNPNWSLLCNITQSQILEIRVWTSSVGDYFACHSDPRHLRSSVKRTGSDLRILYAYIYTCAYVYIF